MYSSSTSIYDESTKEGTKSRSKQAHQKRCWTGWRWQ